MAHFQFKLPDIGEGIAEAEIVTWHVQPGDLIEEDQPLADVMTDKATVEIESPVAGRVVELSAEPGGMLAIGSTMLVLELTGENAPSDESTKPLATEPESDEPIVTSPPASETVQPADDAKADQDQSRPASLHSSTVGNGALATPAVRARAKALGIDLADLRLAKNQRVRHADLDAYLTYNSRKGFGTAAPARQDEVIKLTGLRRKIAENMAASKRHIPHFSYVEEIEVTRLEELRAELNSIRRDRAKITLLPLLIIGICRVLEQFPMINATFDDESGVVTRHGKVHMGIAAQTDSGLMVPVLRNAHAMNVWQLAEEIARLADAARSSRIKREELTGSTLTITSLGALGGIATTPVINRPEVAIIGPNRIIERPVFDGDQIRKAKLMNVSISCDHRVVDGADAAEFVQDLKRSLETPTSLFAD